MAADTLALLGGTPVGAPPQDPHPTFTDRCRERIDELLRSGHTVGLNRHDAILRECEEALAAWQGVPEVMAVSSGHAALHCALMACGVDFGDEVIVSPYTWGASVSCVLHAGAVPVFADVDPATGLLDPESVEERVTARTVAVLPVHLFGQPADLTRLRQVCDRHRLALVEDGSQAHGAIHAGHKVGSIGDVAGFSCMGGKLLATHEAGYVCCANAEVYYRAALNTQHMGRSPEREFPDELRPYVDSLVYTYRASPIDAVMLTEQLPKLDAENDGRRRNVARLKRLLEGCSSVSFPSFGPGDEPAYHMLSANFVPEHAGIERRTWLAALRAEGVGAFCYVSDLIPRWRRLRWQDYDGPAIAWQRQLREAGIDYASAELPGAEHKLKHTFELGWNYIEDRPERMEQLAAAFWKVERNLPALRAHERSGVAA